MTTGREYLRVSVDRSGRQKSNDEQQEDNRRCWSETDFGEPYRDVGSASRHSRTRRDGFDDLLDDLRTDRFGAEHLVLWESSRGSRKVGEWVELLELCEQRSVKIAVTTHGRIYDPSNSRDRKSLIEDAVDSEYESSKISTRVRRDAAALAAAGHPHGPVRFGYRRRYDPDTRRIAGEEPDPAEAPVIEELFARLEAGDSLRAIATDYERRGITTRTGKTMSPQFLRHFATNPAYAGLRLHVPGRRNGRVKPGEGSLTEGQWPAIVSMSRWHAVQKLLGDPTRRTNHGRNVRRGAGRHFLSMIAVCDPCGSVLIVGSENRTNRAPFYRCQQAGHVQVSKAGLDDVAERLIISYLRDRRNTHVDPGADTELAALRDQIAAIQVELDDLADQVGRGDLTAALAARAEPGIRKRLETAQQREIELSTPGVLRRLLGPGADIAARWADMPMSAKREAARLVLSPGYVGQLRVTPNPVPGRRGTPVEERVVLLRKETNELNSPNSIEE
ncbi:recombinase family protein [Phytoactinopolyspora mesophila]|uniref:Recombinase family protein n=1 Tax=Phytoactinopolyspora mesophila TaxID=2650750 RepID=A0A7K3M5L2_9ACTN|nr:recombinase family protein [Phytoactinopolyspora mesophila]NDL58611.1 hypothetical protein [Phytoactinopolyspora mesophila]